MTVRYKISNIFKVSLFIISIIFLSTNIVKSQEENSSENDFSKAENAEEKRVKWGTDEFKLELIKEMSSANIALFIDEHLKTITEPSRIYYKFSKESTREDSFTGNVVLNIVKVEDDNTKHITFRYLNVMCFVLSFSTFTMFKTTFPSKLSSLVDSLENL